MGQHVDHYQHSSFISVQRLFSNHEAPSFMFHLYLTIFQVRPNLFGISLWCPLPFLGASISGSAAVPLRPWKGPVAGWAERPRPVTCPPCHGAEPEPLSCRHFRLSVSPERARERPRGCWTAGAKRECARDPQTPSSRPRPGRPRFPAGLPRSLRSRARPGCEKRHP